jgi:putative ABC transport system permease protein
MFKNMLKRSWLSIVRKPSRSVILIAILFVMANMLLAAVSVKHSVTSSTDYAKEKIGGIVYLSADTDKIRAEMEAAREQVTDSAEASTENPAATFTTPTITEDLAAGIADSSYLKDYTYTIAATANASNFTVVETAANQRERQFQSAFNNARDQVSEQTEQFNAERDQFNRQGSVSGGGGRGSMGAGNAAPNFNFNFNFNLTDPTLSRGDTEIQGINDFNFISGVEAGTISLIDGASFNETTENAVLISQELAEANSLAVGGELKLKTTADETEKTFTILGIYQATAENFNHNTVYTNLAAAKQFLSAEQQENPTVENVKYYLASASAKDDFLLEAAAKYPNLAADNLQLDIDDSTYQTMVGPIENVGSFASTIMWIVMAAALVIITLIVVINVKDRRYEMGVLLSLGAKKTNILGQIFTELIIVGTVGFLFSLGTSQILAKQMGEGMLAQQIASSESETAAPANQPARGMNAGGNMFAAMNGGASSNVQQIDEINVSAGAGEYLTLFGAGYLVLLAAMVLPSINILRYQPKTILTGKE